MDSKIRRGIWRLADPKISTTTLTALTVGFAPACRFGEYSLLWLAVTGLALFCVEVAKNAWGEVIDFESGADLAVSAEDRTDFSGGKRVMVDGLLSKRMTWMVAAVFGVGALILGGLIVFLREPAVLPFAIAGVILAWSYHGPPLKLAYSGFGELDVALCYGPLMVSAIYLIQTGEFSWDVFWLSVPLGLLVAAFLLINEYPDHDADKVAGKNNLVVRLGKENAANALLLIYSTSFAVTAFFPFLVSFDLYPLCGLLSAGFPIAALAAVLKNPNDFYRGRPVQPIALLGFVLYSMEIAIGLLLA